MALQLSLRQTKGSYSRTVSSGFSNKGLYITPTGITELLASFTVDGIVFHENRTPLFSSSTSCKRPKKS